MNEWEDDDKNFDEELERKHANLLLEDIRPKKNIIKREEITSSRSEFDIFAKKNTACFNEDEIACGEMQKLKATSDSSNKNPTDENNASNLILNEESNVRISKCNESDIVCVDSSIEEKKNSNKDSKSRIERFKELVNQSNSKHLSSITSINAIHMNNEHDDSIYIIDSAEYNSLNEKLEKISNIKKIKPNEMNKTIKYFKEQLKIETNQTTCLLQPKLRIAENFGIRPAVYDFIYFMDYVQEPKLELFQREFQLK